MLAWELQQPRPMAYVITDTCTKDELCVQACPVDCIHPKQDEAGFAEAPQLYVKSRRLHRLRRVRSGVPHQFDLRAG